MNETRKQKMKKNIKLEIEIIVIMMIIIGITSAMAAGVPGVPRDFNLIPGDGSITLSWNEPAYDGDSEITGYRIYYGMMADGLSIIDDVATLTYTHTSLTNGNTYYYAVSALNQYGEGEKTEVLETTPELSNPLMEEITVGDWENIHTIYVGEGVYFNLVDATHTMIVESVTSSSMLISVSWNSQPLTMSKGDSKIIDINDDGKDDFKFTCLTITSESAEGFPQTVKFSFTTKNIGGSSEGNTPGFELVALITSIGIVLILLRRGN